MECGFFVCWWMEEEVRQALGERPFCRGMPNIGGKGGLRSQLCSIFANLESANNKMLEDMKLLSEREAATEEAFNKDGAAKAAAVGAIFKTLEEQAKEAMFKSEVGVDIVFDVEAEGGLEHWAGQVLEAHLLFPAHEADVRRVQAKGTEVCASCHFSSGCYKCWWPKTCRYWRNKEMRGSLMEGYAPAAKAAAAAKGKAKAKAKAKLAAGAAGTPRLAAGGPPLQAFPPRP